MDSSGSNDNIKQDLQEEQKTDSATQNARKSFTGDLVISENMIRLNRRWNYSTRPRPNALAIKHPETGEILFPGKKKIEVEEKPEEEGEKLQKPADSIEPTPVVQVPVRDNRHRRTNPFLASGIYADYHQYHGNQPITYFDLPFNNDYH